VHSFCPEKFWNFWNFKEWNHNHKKWVKAGGSSPKIKHANLISKWVKIKDPFAPDPIKKPRPFVKYLLNTRKGS